jgi:hypothetical protein
MRRQISYQGCFKPTERISVIIITACIVVVWLFMPYHYYSNALVVTNSVNHLNLMPKIRDEKRDVKAFPEPLVHLALLDSHAVMIQEEAHRNLREAPQNCSDCTPFHNVREALLLLLPLETFTSVGGMWTIYPNRSNCVIYSVNNGPDYIWEEKMVNYCHDLHVWSCQREERSSKKTKRFIFYDTPCPRRFDSNISLPYQMNNLGYGELDILKLTLEAINWNAWEYALFSVMPMQLILDFPSSSRQESFPSINEERLWINKIFLRLEESGYLVTKVSHSAERTAVTLIFTHRAQSNRDTVLYDQPGDCPDELSIC